MSLFDEHDPDIGYDTWKCGEAEPLRRLPRLGHLMPPALVAAEETRATEARQAAAEVPRPERSRLDSPHMQRLRALAGARLFSDARRR